MNKKLIVLGIAVLLICVGLSGCIDNSQTEIRTIPLSSHIVLAGNLSYPGFYAWIFEFQKGDEVKLVVEASSAVNLYVVPDSAHQTWANTYYHTKNPGLHYPSEQALARSGQTISTTILFTVPNDGAFDLDTDKCLEKVEGILKSMGWKFKIDRKVKDAGGVSGHYLSE